MAIDLITESMRLDIPLVSLVSELEPRLRMSGKELIEESMKPCNIVNFSADELDLHIKAIEECRYPGIYIKKDAYTSTGYRLPDYYALMLVGDYNMTKFWHIMDEMRVKYPVRPKVTILEAMLGPSAESLQRVDELRAAAEVYAAAYGEMQC